MTTQLVLGEAPPPVDPKTLPLAERRPRDFDHGWMEWFARRESDIGLDESLGCYALETMLDGHRLTNTIKVSFAGIGKPVSRGPNKGQRRWDMSRKRAIFVDRLDVLAAQEEWGAETGICPHCDAGVDRYGWSQAEGEKTRPCRKCNGTGRAQRAPTGDTGGGRDEG